MKIILSSLIISLIIVGCLNNSQENAPISCAKKFESQIYLPIMYFKTENVKMIMPDDNNKINLYPNQLYSIFNNTDDTIMIFLINKKNELGNVTKYFRTFLLYDELVHYKGKNDFNMGYTNYEGKERHDSIVLKPNKAFIFPMGDVLKSGQDSLIFKISVKITKNTSSKDTLIKKRLRLHNNEKFVEDYSTWWIENKK